MSAQDIARLADMAGIDAGFRDAWGQWREPHPEAVHALLRAMGFACETPAEIADALRRHEEASWRRLLEPVQVVIRTRSRTPVISVTVQAARAGRPMRWTLQLENGAEHQGTVQPDRLTVTGTRAFGDARFERRAFPLPFNPPYGYHRFRLFEEDGGIGEAALSLIVAPGTCYLPNAAGGRRRHWGIAVQLYGLRSTRNWGIGDFTDLGALIETTATLGADAVGLNPVHALFPAWPEHVSPYSPSSRLFLNVLYIDVEAVPDFADSDAAQEIAAGAEFRARAATLRDAALVDYAAVADAKRRILELVYAEFRTRHLRNAPGSGEATERAAEFRRFQHARGEDLERLGVFEALSEQFSPRSWHDWPEPFRRPTSDEVADFAAAHRDRVEFFQYLQWQANAQLRAAAAKRESLGMAVGLYHDLAVAADGNGCEAWASPELSVRDASIGAPPDEWNHRGQDWGMPPWNPVALRADGYAPFIRLVRANMRHGGALRMDHVMSLMRLYWIPKGFEPTEGAYVRYPFDDLLGVVALESRRQKCVVIGEDLGTLPEGFQGRLRQAQILSYRLLYFQKDEHGDFGDRRAYPRLSVAAVGTHDLAPLAGFWTGRDLDLRAELGLYRSREAEDDARRARAADRAGLRAALDRAGLLPEAVPGDDGLLTPGMVEAIYRFLAAMPSWLLMVHLGDVLDEIEQINLPGTVAEYPNWRRKAGLEIAGIGTDARIAALAAAVQRVRSPAAGRGPS